MLFNSTNINITGQIVINARKKVKFIQPAEFDIYLMFQRAANIKINPNKQNRNILYQHREQKLTEISYIFHYSKLDFHYWKMARLCSKSHENKAKYHCHNIAAAAVSH